ncbi:MAG: DUF2478 domain-containing protein [Paracoccaceae bacterium]|nr:DUF2478 domain-containing protein [Paracoccaceae bacterium]
MQIAFTATAGRGTTDLLLSHLADRLAARGLRLAGTVQTNTERKGGGPCDMDVKVLPAGPIIRISQDLGPSSRGCRLDPEALETAVGLTETRLAEGVDVLIVNKFGKHEAEGRGFRHAIAKALALGVPVLVGLNGLNAAAFEDFTAGWARQLPPHIETIEAWLLTALAGAQVLECP